MFNLFDQSPFLVKKKVPQPEFELQALLLKNVFGRISLGPSLGLCALRLPVTENCSSVALPLSLQQVCSDQPGLGLICCRLQL